MPARPAKTTAEWDRLLNAYPAAVQQTAQAARGRILAAAPGLDETVDAKSRVIGYGFGPGYAGLVCTIILSKTGVKLGLVGGAMLDDPQHLLTGSGKVHRYVAAESEADLKKPAVTALIKSAVAAWQLRQPTRRR
jgi:hypothetical protein